MMDCEARGKLTIPHNFYRENRQNESKSKCRPLLGIKHCSLGSQLQKVGAILYVVLGSIAQK